MSPAHLVPILSLSGAAFLLACAGQAPTAGPAQPPDSQASVPETQLQFLSPARTAPPFGTRTVSFWAVRGEDREVRLMYQAFPNQIDSAEFVRFKVDKASLVTRPDGSTIGAGDSLQITLTIADTLRLILDFQPQGLVFNPSKPARLWIKFGEADPDLDHNGIVNSADTTLLLGSEIWRQEFSTDPWSALRSTVDTVSQEVEADIPGFTRYAVAY